MSGVTTAEIYVLHLAVVGTDCPRGSYALSRTRVRAPGACIQEIAAPKCCGGMRCHGEVPFNANVTTRVVPWAL